MVLILRLVSAHSFGRGWLTSARTENLGIDRKRYW